MRGLRGGRLGSLPFFAVIPTEGASVYEQKELRKQQRALEERFPLKGRCAVRLARAERTVDFIQKSIESNVGSVL